MANLSSSAINKGSEQYPYLSQLNAVNFVSIKLAGEINYDRWHAQMMCLVESHDMSGFIDGTLRNPKLEHQLETERDAMEVRYNEWKRADALLRGWIFCTLTEEVMDTVITVSTAKGVWDKLKATFSSSAYLPNSSTSKRNWKRYKQLNEAILVGDWRKAREIFSEDYGLLTCSINDEGETALHVAIGTFRSIQFLKNLLSVIDSQSLTTMLTYRAMNPLHSAAVVGNVEAAQLLVDINPYLLFTADEDNYLPVHRAISRHHLSTFLCLLYASREHIELSQQYGYDDPFEGRNSGLILTLAIDAGCIDIAFKLIREYPQMATQTTGSSTPMKSIVGKLGEHLRRRRYNIHKRFVKSRQQLNVVEYMLDDEVKDSKSFQLLRCICNEVCELDKHVNMYHHYSTAATLAVRLDIPDALEEIIRQFPKATAVMHNDSYLIGLAVINRCDKAYNLIAHHTNYIHHCDNDGNNLLHMAGQLAPVDKLMVVSGAALQMQRELQWFKEVEKYVPPEHKESKNKHEETPMMVFRREHRELRYEGEEWMKKIADSYTVTAALIVTVAFAAAITIPGGNDSNGKAIFMKKTSFIVFAISNAVSLFTSTISLMLFLSIIASRYAEEDFLTRLPTILICGLVMLYLSLTSMMIAFSATLYLTLGHGKAWILILIATSTCGTIASFMSLQITFLVDLFASTYGHGIFVKRSDRTIEEHRQRT